ncbi:CYTH domain-containing protein [Clostridium sp. SYSU_GA19001]|uniref:class IV adenylate cyclase n=1 Tax=Clostridium caldaquaticum TaxID=2940653 RepID=UPI002076FED0|nr:CYTH domain-containing protein [Clostridium caldaquaticum]MCM8711089.1 CYTH domain-containing protein [Clostridium caldaquaticum]
MKELETRILDIDVDQIRNKLHSLEAEKVKMENQINRIYDFEDRRLLNKKGYARIRTIEDMLNNKTVHYMTIKEMISQEKYKIMNEHETIIDSSEEGENIFKALGLQLVQSIKKYRESYKYKNTLVEIDINEKSFCPFPYIEIETFYEDELKEIVELLGYSMEDTTSKTIYEILSNRGVKGL